MSAEHPALCRNAATALLPARAWQRCPDRKKKAKPNKQKIHSYSEVTPATCTQQAQQSQDRWGEVRAICGRSSHSTEPTAGPAESATGSSPSLPCAELLSGAGAPWGPEQARGTQGTKYMPCCGQALPGKREHRVLSCLTLLDARLGLWPACLHTWWEVCSTNLHSSPGGKQRKKPCGTQLSACPVSTCTDESCSCQARYPCLPPRLVTLDICHQGLGAAALPAWAWPPGTSWPSAASPWRNCQWSCLWNTLLSGISPQILWSHSCYFAFSTGNSRTLTEMLKQDWETQNSALPALPAQPPLQPSVCPAKVISATWMVKHLAFRSQLGGSCNGSMDTAILMQSYKFIEL